MFKKYCVLGVCTLTLLTGLTGCEERQSVIVSENLSKEADNFNTVRKVTVINVIKNDVIFTMTGRMSIKADKAERQLEITVENDNKKYQKHIIGLSDNVSYIVEDTRQKDVDRYNYEINYNPKMWVPVKFKNID